MIYAKIYLLLDMLFHEVFALRSIDGSKSLKIDIKRVPTFHK